MWKSTTALVSFLLVQFLLGLAFGGQTCPDSQLATTCKCIDAYAKIFLKCKKTTDEDLRKSLTALNGYNLTELHIENSTLRHIPTNVVKGINIYRIHVLDSTLFYLFDKPLSGSVASSLQYLKLNNVDFELGLDWSLFEEADSLKEVVLTSTPIYRVYQSLVDLDAVETLEISSSELEYIHPKGFYDMKNLRNLILKNNMLQVFTRQMLPFPKSDIQFLDLSNNHLYVFPKNVFDGMPKLNSLMIHGNKFITLEEEYMSKIWHQLFFFNVGSNPLECCRLSWLAKREKPTHFFGNCVEKDTASVRELKEMEENDFANCK